MRNFLEEWQIWIYFAAILTGAIFPGDTGNLITPALAFMLFVTFLQVPLADIGRGLRAGRFLPALLVANFVAVPLLAFPLSRLVGDEAMRLGVLLVLLAPCIDYVITFAQMGRADARSLLAATPVLLVAQMLLLPLFLGTEGFAPEPFLHALVWMIAVPLGLAAAVRRWGGGRVNAALAVMPVPATAAVLYLVVAAAVPIITGDVLGVLPVYAAFAVLAPVSGWAVARAFRLHADAARAVAFSAATRNSLVVLPLATAVPGAPLLPAIIVAQTLIELVAELVYIRVIPRLIR